MVLQQMPTFLKEILANMQQKNTATKSSQTD